MPMKLASLGTGPLLTIILLNVFTVFPVGATTFYVSDMGNGADGLAWPSAFVRVGEALTASASGDSIWVKSATYSESITLKNGVSLFGGFDGTEPAGEFDLRNPASNETVIDATGLGMSVVVANNISMATVDGFTLTGGDTQVGGGFFLNRSSPLIQNCRIRNNRASSFGAGIQCFDHSYPIITRCEIFENGVEVDSEPTYGGGICVSGVSVPTLFHCSIHHNFGRRGGGLCRFDNGSFIIRDCTITENISRDHGGGIYGDAQIARALISGNTSSQGQGGGAFLTDGSSLSDSTLSLNSAREGGGLLSQGAVSVSKVAFFGNTSIGYGGGIYANPGLSLVNSIVSENHSGSRGGGAFLLGRNDLSFSTITQNRSFRAGAGVFVQPDGSENSSLGGSIVWGNVLEGAAETEFRSSGYEISVGDLERIVVAYSDVRGGWEGEGNIDSDPFFEDATNSNFRLRACSPCIDTASTVGPSIDLRGAHRPIDFPGLGREGTGDEFDMGAFETIPGERPLCFTNFERILFVSDTGNDTLGLNWETAFHSIAEALSVSLSGDAIFVKAGTYSENIVLEDGVSLFGGFSGTEAVSEYHLRDPVANETVIDATGLEKSVVTATDILIGTLDGFTLTGGSAFFGGGLLASGSTLQVRNCVIKNNVGETLGGGVYLLDQSNLDIADSEISHNRLTGASGASWGGGICVAQRSEAKLTRCLISHNQTEGRGGGAGVFLQGSYSIFDCTFTENVSGFHGGGAFGVLQVIGSRFFKNTTRGDGGGLFLEPGSSLAGSWLAGNVSDDRGGGLFVEEGSEIDRCGFTGNEAVQGGAIYLTNPSTVSNSLIASNTAALNGGGVVAPMGSDWNHCTFTENHALGEGGAIYGTVGSGDSVRVTNSILWNNRADQPNSLSSHPEIGRSEFTVSFRITYSDVRWGVGGMGNISSDPRFLAPEDGDFRLDPCSPCVDSGGESEAFADLTGKARPFDVEGVGAEATGMEFDRGAYEVHLEGPSGCPPPTPTPSGDPYPRLAYQAFAEGGASIKGATEPVNVRAHFVLNTVTNDLVYKLESGAFIDTGTRTLGIRLRLFSGGEPGPILHTLYERGGAPAYNAPIRGSVALSATETLELAAGNLSLVVEREDFLGGEISGPIASLAPARNYTLLNDRNVRVAYLTLDEFLFSAGYYFSFRFLPAAEQAYLLARDGNGIEDTRHEIDLYLSEGSERIYAGDLIFSETDVLDLVSRAMYLGFSPPTSSFPFTNQDQLIPTPGPSFSFTKYASGSPASLGFREVTVPLGTAVRFSFQIENISAYLFDGIELSDPLIDFVNSDSFPSILFPGDRLTFLGGVKTATESFVNNAELVLTREGASPLALSSTAVVNVDPTLPTYTPLPTATPTPRPTRAGPCDSGYYILDSMGGRHRVGNPVGITGPVYFGIDIARDMERAECGDLEDLVVLDGFGAAHFVANASCNVMQDFYFGDADPQEFPKGRAVDLEMADDSQGFWVLTDFGGIYRAGSAMEAGEEGLVEGTDRNGTLGFDIPFGAMRDSNLPETGATLRAVSLGVFDTAGDSKAEAYLILDSQGGRFQLAPDGTEMEAGSSAGSPHNDPTRLWDPTGYVWPFFPGLDIARDLELHESEAGVVILDGWDGIHPVPVNIEDNPVYFATNRVSNSDPTPVDTVGMPYLTLGFDDPSTGADESDPLVYGPDVSAIFTDLEFTRCEGGLYTMDSFGGVFALGMARIDPLEVSAPFRNGPYFFPFLYAEDLEAFGVEETEFPLKTRG